MKTIRSLGYRNGSLIADRSQEVFQAKKNSAINRVCILASRRLEPQDDGCIPVLSASAHGGSWK